MFLGMITTVIISCDQTPAKSGNTSTPTSGEVTIGVDATLQPLAQEELSSFQASYPSAKIKILYAPESELFVDFLNNKTSAILAARPMTSKEEEFLRQSKSAATKTRIGFDAIALIINKSNLDTELTVAQQQDLFTGKITDWSIWNKSHSGKIQVVFDHQGSSTLRQIMDSFKVSPPLPSTFSALKSNEDVIAFVEKNPNAIGIIGVNWISNQHDAKVNHFMDQVKVMSLYPSVAQAEAVRSYKPYQAYIAQKSYPLIRRISYINREARTGLATGFAAFLAGPIGQTILLKAGLIPANAPVRLVEFKTSTPKTK